MFKQLGAQQFWRGLALYIDLAEAICHALQYTGIACLLGEGLRRIMLLQLIRAHETCLVKESCNLTFACEVHAAELAC